MDEMATKEGIQKILTSIESKRIQSFPCIEVSVLDTTLNEAVEDGGGDGQLVMKHGLGSGHGIMKLSILTKASKLGKMGCLGLNPGGEIM